MQFWETATIELYHGKEFNWFTFREMDIKSHSGPLQIIRWELQYIKLFDKFYQVASYLPSQCLRE